MKSGARLRNNLVLAALLSISCATASGAASPQGSGHSPQFDAGCKQMQLKRFPDAISSMTEAIAVDPKDSLAFFRRGQCFQCLGKYQEAVSDFEHAITLDKDISTYYLWRGTAEAKLGHDKNAVRNYLKAMRLDPALVITYNAAQGAKPTAEKRIGNELASPPSASEAAAKIMHPDSAKRADSFSMGYSANAMQDYLEAIKRASIKSTAVFRPGTVYSGICETSDSGMSLGVKLGSEKDGTISKKNGSDYFSLNGSTREIHELETQLGDQPGNAGLYYEKGRLLQQMGWTEMALDDFNRAVDLDKENAQYRLARAFLYQQSQKDELAEKDIEQAINLDPDLPEKISFTTPATKSASTTPDATASTPDSAHDKPE